MLDFFKNGGVFLFDENDAKSEATYYKLENLMYEEAGEDITETYIASDSSLCLFYDCSIISEDEAMDKYNNGEYKKFL